MRNNKGNVLFIILIGILLSALLAETISSFMSTTREPDVDRAKALVAHIDEQETLIRNAYNMLRMANDCDVTEINFTLTETASYNSNAPASGRCDMYGAKGGAIRPMSPAKEAQMTLDNAYEEFWLENAGIEIDGLGTTDSADTDCAGCELTLVLYNLTDEVCRQINMNRVGVRTIYEMEGTDEIVQQAFDVTFANNTLIDAADSATLVGQRAFCIKEAGGGERNIYISVLEVR